MQLLEVERLTVVAGCHGGAPRTLVSDVSLTLDAGGRLALVGESGSGKSTTLMAIAGLLPSGLHADGEVRLAGRRLLGRDARELAAIRWTDIAIVFQSSMNTFSPVATVGAQLALPLVRRAGMEKAQARARARELLEQVELPAAIADRFPHELSGGMRQRAAIALALTCRPRLLLADEPTTALDPIRQAQVLLLMRRLADELGLALVLVTHDLGAAATVCDRIAVMRSGRIVEAGTVRELLADARHEYTRELLAAARYDEEAG